MTNFALHPGMAGWFSYLPDMFLFLVIFSCLLKTCQTDLNALCTLQWKLCLILRRLCKSFQQNQVQRVISCICIYTVRVCLHSPSLCCSQPLCSLSMGTRLRRRGEGASQSPLLSFCHQRDRRAGCFPSLWWSLLCFCVLLSSLPKMTFSSS